MSSLSSTPPWQKPKPNSSFKGFNFAGFTSGQITFAIDLAMGTGLDLGVVAAWLLAEESGSAATLREGTGNNNWLNIGYFDSGRGQISFSNVFKTPDTAAAATTRFLKGTWGGASAGIQAILNSVGKSAGDQIAAIQKSGWATSGYPSLPQIYSNLAPGLAKAGSLKGASPGGTAGAGGTGTLINDSSGFRVGDPTNPDEDFWSAINRLAQERYWYIFSDGETLYLADGPDLMKQTPALEIDRVADMGSISHLEFTFDNCLAVDTPIQTPNGWTLMGDLRTGDYVFGSDGKPTRIVRAHRVHHERDCYRVRLSDGTTIVADDSHLWETLSYRKDSQTTREVTHQRYLGVRTTRQIAETLRVRCSDHGRPSTTPNYSYNHAIRSTPALVFPEADLPIDPYVFGYWLGDGCSGSSTLTVGDGDLDHVVKELETAGYGVRVRTSPPRGISKQQSHGVDFSLAVPWRRAYHGQDCLSRRLRTLGVFGNKHIPDLYLRSSRSQRLALLQGLMDSDGTYSGHGCGLGFANRQLALDAVELVRSLGYRTTGAKYKPPQGVSRPQYGIGFTVREDLNCFRMPRKAERYAERVRSRRCAVLNRKIVAVEPVPSVPVRCITVEAEDHLFLAGEGLTITCNTAWQYAATHKKRKRTQRRTALAKVTSPVEGILNVICKIDEVRAGDVVGFDNCGPGDGQWLAGDVRRSVFEVLSEITVVPALTPLTEGQLNPAGTNQKNSVFANLVQGAGTGNYKGYVNPVGLWKPGRVDQGIDGTLQSDYLAPTDSFIVSGPSGSWPGGSYLAGRILNGPLKGKVWYVAEGVTPIVPQGATVKAGQPVARPSTGLNGGSPSGLIETGWADPGSPHQPLSQSLPSYGGDQSPQALACGNSFNRFVVKLGGSPASIQGAGRGVAPAPLPGNYP